MATWITHLRLAEILLERIEGLDPALFAIGNIAPDSGIPDETWEKFTPDPAVTHFTADGGGVYQMKDAVFFREALDPLRNQLDTQVFSMRLGYWFHLISDNLWSVEIGRPTHVRYQREFAADPKFIWTVKEDWYGLDFVFVRANPNSLFWKTFITASCDDTRLNFLPLDALKQRIAYIQEYYQSTGKEIDTKVNRPFEYLSQAQMDHFVDLTAQTLLQAYEAAWVDEADLSGVVSVLETIGYQPKGIYA